MFGISYGEVFLLLGAAAALIGPKDLPIIARTAGKLAGRAIGYVQVARGQFESVMQQSQARQVHKELQDTMTQLEAIRHEIRSISFMNPGPLTTRVVDNVDRHTSSGIVDEETSKPSKENSARVKNAATLKVLSMSRLGGPGAVAPLVTEILITSVEASTWRSLENNNVEFTPCS
ncbi:Hypothetical predicted protein [Olea europaea subsp. europaea]|uniref:Sec-independent protein translocase protein TatB n=1 Tax=Olea europaea subsp. europaea TaxID=158383 RepID=A0A8S0QDS7_OLEEU|nr:Hypothetical predicted protein [Olea europaea subsp. europaea]